MKKFKLFYGNEWVDAENGKTFEPICPCTGEAIAEVSYASRNDVQKAIDAAHAAFASGVWSDLDPEERAPYLHRVADVLERRLEEFAKWESLDTGKPIGETRNVDIPLAIRAFRFHADGIKALKGQVINIPGKRIFDYVTYEPYGVVGAIAPWNFPLHLLTRTIAAALAAGNTVVCKPALLTSVTAQLLGEAFLEAGVPAGVYNSVAGPGGDVGEELLANDKVSVVALTGSEQVGRRLMHASADAPRIKKLALELGGKSAVIAAKDCDVNAAVNAAMLGICFNQGEVCVSTSRLLLADEIYEPFMKSLVKRLERIRIGDCLSEDSQMGSLVSAGHRDSVHGFVERAVAQGAVVATGGKPLAGGVYDKGFYYPPTVLENVARDMEVFQEEVFGPVLSVTRFKTLDEAIELANATRFALGAAIFSEDIRTLYWTARKLDAGTVWMNCVAKSNIEAPFGGNRNSGLGRENGTEGLLEYLKVKNNIMVVSEYEDAYGYDD